MPSATLAVLINIPRYRLSQNSCLINWHVLYKLIGHTKQPSETALKDKETSSFFFPTIIIPFSVIVFSFVLCPLLDSWIFNMVNQDHLRWEFIKENKKVRKQEKKEKRTRPRKWPSKKEKRENGQENKKVWSGSLSWSSSFFLFSCFLTFLFSFINSHLSSFLWIH